MLTFTPGRADELGSADACWLGASHTVLLTQCACNLRSWGHRPTPAYRTTGQT